MEFSQRGKNERNFVIRKLLCAPLSCDTRAIGLRYLENGEIAGCYLRTENFAVVLCTSYLNGRGVKKICFWWLKFFFIAFKEQFDLIWMEMLNALGSGSRPVRDHNDLAISCTFDCRRAIGIGVCGVEKWEAKGDLEVMYVHVWWWVSGGFRDLGQGHRYFSASSESELFLSSGREGERGVSNLQICTVHAIKVW